MLSSAGGHLDVRGLLTLAVVDYSLPRRPGRPCQASGKRKQNVAEAASQLKWEKFR